MVNIVTVSSPSDQASHVVMGSNYSPKTSPALRVVGSDARRALHFVPPVLLAPMEGVTDQIFRNLVAELGGLGGACTDFVRLSVAPASRRVLQRRLGVGAVGVPVGIQFMAAEARHVAASVAAAESAGAAFIDLNFGCPAPGVFAKCAGSALLAQPQRLAEIVAAAVGATGLPVGVKLRAGIESVDQLENILSAAVATRPAFVTLHARLRTQSYSEPATWDWLRQAREILTRIAPGLPFIGNGGVTSAADVTRMRKETGCDAVMIGCGAIADPFIFRVAAGGASATRGEAADFALRYADALTLAGGPRLATARLKQLLRWYRAGGLFAAGKEGDEDERRQLLRSDGAAIRAWFTARLQPAGGR